MSGSASGAGAWQRSDLVQHFLADRQRLLPLLDVQEQLIERIFNRSDRDVERFIDVGSGDGASSELMLRVFPEAEAVLVDYSEPMLERAGARLGAGEGRWQAVRGDLREPSWTGALPRGSYDAAISSFAIHHLAGERKRALFAEVFGLLSGGATFVNLDVVEIGPPLAGLFDEQMVANVIALERERGGPRTDAEIERDMLADSRDDQPSGAEEQLRWLREAGFQHVELHFKWAEAAIFGAIKPS